MTFAQHIGLNRVVFALSVARLGDAVGNSILFIVLPLYVAKLPAPHFHVPETLRVGILIALYGLISAAVQPLTGVLSDRLGRHKPLILAGLVVMGISTILFTLASSFWQLLLLRATQGIGVALTILAAMAVMTSATARETRGSAMGVYTTMRMAGFAGGPLLGGALFDAYGFDITFYVGAGAILIGFVLVQLAVKEPPPVVRQQGAAAIAAPAFALTADLSSAGREARQMSVVTSAFGLGIALGPLLARLLAVWSFALPFVVVGILSLVAATAVHFLVPETVT